jgi:hypothetical protein
MMAATTIQEKMMTRRVYEPDNREYKHKLKQAQMANITY